MSFHVTSFIHWENDLGTKNRHHNPCLLYCTLCASVNTEKFIILMLLSIYMLSQTSRCHPARFCWTARLALCDCSDDGRLYTSVKYGVRSPKFIWDLYAQLYSMDETPQLPPSPAFGLIYEGAFGQPR
jgi:hypothetical protein